MGLQVVHLDTETSSAVDPFATSFDYLAKNCRIDLLTWGVAPDFTTMPTEVKGWDARKEPIPEELKSLLADPSNWFVAFNSGFDETVIANTLGVHHVNNWLDSGVAAAMYGYSVGKLEHTAALLKCRHQKVELLPGLMKLFSGEKLYGNAKTYRGRALRNKDGSIDAEYYTELRDAYMAYGIEDTWSSAEIFVTCMLLGEQYPIADFLLHQRINRRGIGVDLDFTQRMQSVVTDLKEDGKCQLRGMCGVDYEVASHPGFAKYLKQWQPSWEGGSRKDELLMLAAERERALGEDDLIVKASKLKIAVTGTAGAKYNKLLSSVHPDTNRLYQGLRFNGAARTGRPTGSGVQMLNLPRPYKIKKSDEAYKAANMPLTEWVDTYGHQASEVAAKIFRACFIPKVGSVFCDYDFSSIESVILVETTQDPEGLRIRREGLDGYVAFGTKMFNQTYDQIIKDTLAGGHIRQDSKPAVLGCGYGLSGPGLQDYAKSMGLYLSLSFWVKAVNIWRSIHPTIVDSWEYMDILVKLTLDTAPGTVISASELIPNNPVKFERHRNAIVMRLPCGRGIWYMEPRIEQQSVPYRDKETGEPREFLTNSFTYLNNKGTKQWREGTHGGKLTGNCCQSLGNSLLREWMRNVDDAGVEIVLHVYDQIVAEVPLFKQEESMQIIQDCNPGLNEPNHWASNWNVQMDGGAINRFWK